MNQTLANIFREMSFLLEMENIPFKPRAYEKAAFSLESLSVDLDELYKKEGFNALLEIPGVGKGIAEKIEEYIKTGKIKEYLSLAKKTPVDLKELSGIEGIGPKHIKTFYQKLKIKNLKELETAAKLGKIRNIPGFGKKSEEKILKILELKLKSEKRYLLSDILPAVKRIEDKLRLANSFKKIAFCGSIRRKKETVGNIDILIVSDNPEKTADIFAGLSEVSRIYSKGKTKVMARLANGADADLRIVPEKSFGSALQYFTGNKDHNIELRKIASEKGYKLNEYGLYKIQNKKLIQIAGKTEKEIYEKLGLEFIPPELREARKEIEAAKNKALPSLIKLEDIKGDLQIQTNWTDGSNSIEEMAQKAAELNYEYIAITDHTKSLAMTRGSDEKKLLRQIKEIEKINKNLKHNKTTKKIKILSGAEVNILKDGTLDIENKVLSKLDFAGAAVHSNFHLSRGEQTARVIKAMENENIDIIFHPTGRIINKREPLDIDIQKIFEAAARTKTILEINAYPSRLDLKNDHIILAKNYGVKFMINTDAHSAPQMNLMEHGIYEARRAWLEKNDVLNTLPLQKLLEILKKPKKERW